MNSGFGSFGSPSGFNTSSSLFSSTQNRPGGLFGSSTTTTAPATSTGGLFGSTTPATTTTSFGGFGTSTTPTLTSAQTGTGHVKFQAPTGQDTVTKNGVQSTITTNHQCITAMKEYENKSIEELRMEDYQANRKFPQQTSGFGTSTSLFGSSTPATTTSGFGSTGLFGSTSTTTAAKPAFGGFGTTTTATTPSTTTGLFGSTQAKPAFGGFGTTTTTTAPTTGFGGFGTQQPTTTTSTFGSTQPSTSLFGGLGSSGTTTTTGTGTSLFGSTQPTTTGTSLFGSTTTQQQQKPLFGGFGSTATTTATPASTFSFGTTQPAATTTPTTSIFGQTQSPLSTAKPFGGFGTGTTTTGFGSTTTTTTPSTGLFGSTTTQQKPAFGLGTGTTTTGTTGFGTGFGTTATGTTGTTGGLFGSGGFGTTTTPAATASPFAATTTTATPFGQTTTGGLFGSTQPAPTTGGLFGSAPTTTSTGFGTTGFGTPTQQQTTTPSIFGTTTTPSTGGGLFGSTTTQPAQSTFGTGLGLGTTTTQSTGLGSFSLGQPTTSFGLSQPAQQTAQIQQPQVPTVQPLVQQQLMALTNSPYGTASLLKTQLQDYSKKEDIFKPVSPIAQRPYITEATSPPKVPNVLSQITQPSEYKGGLSQTLKLTTKPLTQISKKTDLFEGLDEEETPVFYPRKNIKKLLFKPQVDQSSRLSSTSNTSINGDTQFLPRKPNLFTNEQAQITNDLTNVSDDGTDNHSEISTPPCEPHPAGIVLERPGYFTIPSLSELANMVDAKTGDCIVDNFAIGRVDYGCITYPGLTNLKNMNLDEIIHIRRKEVHVYPDDTKKPAVGQGLNKPAEVTLHRIWPSDKQTRMPITDPNRIINMGYNKKIEKATIEMGAQFIDYDPVTGSWTFKVKHFSKYGLDDSDDEEEVEIQTTTVKLPNLDPVIKKEKDMIQRQMKLIELRRFELQQQSKKNLSTITNQQWDIIKDYAPKTDKKFSDNSNIHLELSTDETSDQDDVEDEGQSVGSSENSKKSICKQLVLDQEESVLDEDKENKIYPSLNGFRKSENKVKTLYPNLDNLQTISNQCEDMIDEIKDDMNNETVMNEDKMDELPFQMDKFRDNRKLVDAFFNEDKDEDFFSNNQIVQDEYPYAKFGGFNQKPITGGLLKRGLGGISNLDQENKIKLGDTNVTLSASLTGDQFHGQSKVLKQNIGSMTIADVQQKMVSKVLKPQLWNRFKTQKQVQPIRRVPIDYEHNDEKLKNLNINSDAQVPSISSKSLIEFKNSFTNNLNWCLTDLGLFNSRRFNINWTMNPSCYTYTQLAPVPKNATFRNMCLVKSLNTLSLPETIPAQKMKTITENTEKFLQIQLDLTDFVHRSNNLNLFKVKSGNQLVTFLNECTENLRNSIGDNPDADNIENMRIILSLCSKLWGDIPDEVKSNNYDSNMSQYETEQIRKRLLSEWLVQVSSHRIEKECKSLKFNKNKENYLSAIFSYLSGNRLLDACNVAIENSDYRLALLISQSSGSNDTVRTMMKKQLNEWFNSNSDKFINAERLKLYVLISGELVYNISGQKPELINVCEDLDWKRQFGIHLWYQCLPINSITDALNQYEKSVSNDICTKPVPTYVEDTITDTKNPINLLDTCYHLIKLYCNNTYPIQDIISPLNHGPNQLDFRLSWHLTMSLIALQYNHIPKFSIENLHDSFAAQLQSIGLWHWAVFVLMHIEDDQRREKFVRLYLSRNVTSQSELTPNEKFLIEKLKIPSEWVYEYKALRAKYEHQDENQLELLLKAHKWNEAHTVLIELIAPDLFITKNFQKLNSYLTLLSKDSTCINKWNFGGQIYLDYIRLFNKEQVLFEFSEEDDGEKILDEDLIKESNEQLMNLSSRLKEFDTKNAKKLLCSLMMSQLVLKFFNVFNELTANEDQEIQDEETGRKLTKLIVEKAQQQTLQVPDQELLLLHLNDLEQIKISLLSELKSLESKRSIYLNELDTLKFKIKTLNQTSEILAKNIDISEARLKFHSQKINDVNLELVNKVNLVSSYDLIIKNLANKSNEFNTFSNSLEKCFDFNNNCLNRRPKFYLFNTNLTKKIDLIHLKTSFSFTDDPEKACFSIIPILNLENISRFLIENKNKTNFIFLGQNESKKSLKLLFNNLLFDSIIQCSFLASFYNEPGDPLHLNFGLIESKNTYEKDPDLILDRQYLIAFEFEHQDDKSKIILDIFQNLNNFYTNSSLNFEILLKSKFLIITKFDSNFTTRFIEALKSATIPVLIDLNYKLPLNELISWDEIIIRLSLHQIKDSYRILNDMTRYDLIQRRIKARQVYNSYFKTLTHQFRAILTGLLDKINIPPSPIYDYKPLEFKPELNPFEKLNFSRSIDEEYIGEVNQFKKESFKFSNNYTQSKYKLWNFIYHPFNLFPSDPFFFNYLSEFNFKDWEEKLFVNFTGGGDGRFFHSHLSGNYEIFEQFTIVILTHHRESILTTYIEAYFKSVPYLNSILIVWNSIETEPNWKLWSKFSQQFSQNRLKILKMEKNSLNNRFLPFDLIQTDAILNLDDDVLLRPDEIILAFRVWRENRERIVGFPARYHTFDLKNKSILYQSYLSCEYSMVLTGAAFYHRFYNYYYMFKMDGRLRKKVDELMNCEDISFNMMVAHLTRKTPIKVTTKYSFYCADCENIPGDSPISLQDDHYKKRSECMEYFVKIYGYNPLLYSQFRADSVLYKTKLSKNQQRCFKLI
ncbi:unnamed protein product [Brachionus calyciflorus]|uniref:Nuclear pore complex protein Nup98-Nup96 n=1 Tax=Brachionus calyciflorus TaxID=104777 RepID=A0A813WJV0_9BILA|nr:unnamed protein product [Brachionus calyciflorus]